MSSSDQGSLTSTSASSTPSTTKANSTIRSTYHSPMLALRRPTYVLGMGSYFPLSRVEVPDSLEIRLTFCSLDDELSCAETSLLHERASLVDTRHTRWQKPSTPTTFLVARTAATVYVIQQQNIFDYSNTTVAVRLSPGTTSVISKTFRQNRKARHLHTPGALRRDPILAQKSPRIRTAKKPSS